MFLLIPESSIVLFPHLSPKRFEKLTCFLVVGQFVFALDQLVFQFNYWHVLRIIFDRHFSICGLDVTSPLPKPRRSRAKTN